MRALRFAADVARNRRRQTTPPRFLTYTVTFACNARCVMCDSWRKPADDDMTADEVDRIFAQLPRMDAVRLTGGEPFVRKDLLQIARSAQDHLDPVVLHLTTNGFLTERIIDFCERLPRRARLLVLVSIDGVGAKHDAIRGSRVAYRSAMRTVEELARRRDELGLTVAVNQTIVDAEGAEHYRLLGERLAAIGVRHHVVVAYAESATYSIEPEVDVAPKSPGQFDTFGAIERSELEALLDAYGAEVERWPAAERAAKRYYLRGLRRRLLDGVADPSPRCVALSAHMRLFPNGDVPTCQFNTTKVGNLRRQPFEAVWSGEPHRKQRAWVNACAGCWAECEVVPSALYTGDLVRGLRRPR